MSFLLLYPREIEIMMKQKNAMIIDIRDTWQYKQNHFMNARNIPYQECESWLDYFSSGKCYIIYCEYGNTSLLVSRKLAKRGISAYTVVGGWQGVLRYYGQSQL